MQSHLIGSTWWSARTLRRQWLHERATLMWEVVCRSRKPASQHITTTSSYPPPTTRVLQFMCVYPIDMIYKSDTCIFCSTLRNTQTMLCRQTWERRYNHILFIHKCSVKWHKLQPINTSPPTVIPPTPSPESKLMCNVKIYIPTIVMLNIWYNIQFTSPRNIQKTI